MTDNSSRTASDRPNLKAGDRFWITFAEDPTDIEKYLASALQGQRPQTSVYHVHAFSWSAMPRPCESEVIASLPKNFELPHDRSLVFFEVNDETSLKIPRVSVRHSEETAAGVVATTAEKFKFRNELVLFVCSAFDEHEKGTNELVGSWDAVGFIALTFGDNIISAPIFSAYFKLAERKFCNGEATVVGSDERENNIYGLKGFYDEDKLDATDAKTHAALWFVGRAFSEKSSSIKIIFYYIALEIICGKRSQDYLRRFYRGDLGQLAADEVRMIKGFRDDLVHRGHVKLLNKQAERKIQTIILDVIVHEKTDTSHFAFQHIGSKN